MATKWNCGMLTRYGRVNIRKRNNERADNRHEKNWSNNLPEEHNYTNIKKHKNCNLLYINFYFFGQMKAFVEERRQLRLCSVGRYPVDSHSRASHFEFLLNIKLISTRRFCSCSPSSFDWFVSLEFWRFDQFFIRFRWMKKGLIEFLVWFETFLADEKVSKALRKYLLWKTKKISVKKIL